MSCMHGLRRDQKELQNNVSDAKTDAKRGALQSARLVKKLGQSRPLIQSRGESI